MTESDLSYYERRLAEELREMNRAERQEVRAVHRKLAEMYRQRVVAMKPTVPING